MSSDCWKLRKCCRPTPYVGLTKAPRANAQLPQQKKEFEKQLRTFTPYSDPKHPTLATTRLLAATFLTEPHVVAQWCQNDQLPYRQIDDEYYFDPESLLEHFEWSM